MSAHYAYRFDGDYVQAILDGEKTATVRLDDEREPEPGDELTAFSAESDEVFARLKVKAVARVPVIDAFGVLEAMGVEYGADFEDELWDSLVEHYGLDHLDVDRTASVIEFRAMEGVTREVLHA